MRSLVLLSLMLLTVSVAQAGFEIVPEKNTVSLNEIISVNIVLDTMPTNQYLLFGTSIEDYDRGRLFYNSYVCPTTVTEVSWIVLDQFVGFLVTFDTRIVNVPDQVVHFGYQAGATGKVDLLLYTLPDDFTSPTLIDTETITNIPEPATLALLAFGGFLLRPSRK